jgi:hypothetical protein
MADYTNIKGFNFVQVSSDPANPVDGQLWYNTTAKQLKGKVAGAAAWSSGGAMARVHYRGVGAGSQNAALHVGGQPGPEHWVEEYNGSTWSAQPNLPRESDKAGGCGTQTAAIVFGGQPPPTGTSDTLEYDGSAWTSGGTLNTGGSDFGSFGTAIAAAKFGGNPGSPPFNSDATEEYNGSSWTTVNSLPELIKDQGGAGTQTAGLAIGGDAGPGSQCYEYDGTNWGFAGSMSNPRAGGHGHFGVQNAAVAVGANAAPIKLLTEEYDGSSWSSAPSRSDTMGSISSTGTSTSGLAFGGENPAHPTAGVGGATTVTEEYSATGTTVQTINSFDS